MKKILILTTSTGEGHNQAANSISIKFEESGYKVIKHDFLKNNSKLLTKIFINGYELSASTFPKIYGYFYKLTNTAIVNILIHKVFYFIRKKLFKIVSKEKPDIILVTHPFAVTLAVSIKESFNIPSLVIVTDFKAHGTYINNNIDGYIVASDDTKANLNSRGIDLNKIHTFGIPVKDEFFINRVENLLNPDGYFNILLMSGSMGLRNISYVLKELLNNKNKLRITIVCGKNETLKQDLTKRYNQRIKDKKVHILGFSNDIDVLMEYSDLIISKPGGLTATEAIAKHLPLLIPFAIPGQEYENIEVLTSNGYALYLDNFLELNSIIDRFIDNPQELNKIKDNMINLSNLYSKEKIVNLADKLLENKNV
ncbi:glycosyltransferase [Clostridium sp.]|uniref:MGDG synthase family glycosyltransferase n=1 Tax=Clostridium sp. TaxID=1506 RepID=UPI0026315311|nr:glycosyltransferase [Clostridium sp.]